MSYCIVPSVLAAVGLVLAAEGEATRTLTGGKTGRVAIAEDASVGGLLVDVNLPGNSVNGGELHVVGRGRLTVGAGGVKDVTREGRYCVFRVPLAFSRDQIWRCAGTEQMYFYGPLADADPNHPASVVKCGPHALCLGESAADSTFSGTVRVEEGGLCFLCRNPLGARGELVFSDGGFLWFGGGENARRTIFRKSCRLEQCVHVMTWGVDSVQTGEIVFENARPGVRIEGGKTLDVQGGVSLASGTTLVLDVLPRGKLRISGKPWIGPKAELVLSGAGGMEFAAQGCKFARVFSSGTVDFRTSGTFADDCAPAVALTAGTWRLNGTTQRVGSLSLEKGARVLGPGRLMTSSGVFDLTEGGRIGDETARQVDSGDWKCPISVGEDLQIFWDDLLVDKTRTTARRVLHHPECKGTVITHDEPWEGDGNGYFRIFQDGDIYRMYYRAFTIECGHAKDPTVGYRRMPDGKLRICYAESRDLIHWTKPNLGLFEFNGSRQNNIVADWTIHPLLDNFYVFRDDSPVCRPGERYKGVTMWPEYSGDKVTYALALYVSEDPFHFKFSRLLAREGGNFDSFNILFWDEFRKRYFCYFRGFHQSDYDRYGRLGVRDINFMTSADGDVWSKQKRISYLGDTEDYAMYTNGVQPYPRNPKLFVGIPTRYVERGATWTRSFDRLPSPEERRKRMEDPDGKMAANGEEPWRNGLALTDCLFMFSRDGENFTRYDEAFIRPGPEAVRNWLYGDCYASVGLVQSPGREGAAPELNFFCYTGAWMGGSVTTERYTLRMDGFVSRQADYVGARVVTKPLVFAGNRLLLNFSTSARGHVFVTVTAEDGTSVRSVELFGDQVDRIVDFEDDAALAGFAGKSVRLTFDMSDADVYSFRFVRENQRGTSSQE